MDVMAGAAQKALETLKSVPGWLLVGISICLLSIGVWPPFFALVPESLQSYLPMAFTVAVILTGCKLVGSWLAHVLKRRHRSLERDQERLVKLYRPLAALFLTRHISVSTGRASPLFRHRLQNARAELNAYRRRSVCLRRAWQALFDQHISSSAEVEFGGDFPLSRITDIVKKEAAHADTKLFRLVSRADRSRYEEPDRYLMTDEEFALADHIEAEHRRLSVRAGKTA
jgi:hypothetical protein